MDARATLLQQQSQSPPPNPFRKLFRERTNYLFASWSSSLVSLAYLRQAHDDKGPPEYLAIMKAACALVGCSFAGWIISYVIYEVSVSDPGHWLGARLFVYGVVYGAAIQALAMTYFTLFFPGVNHRAGAIGIAVAILVGIACLEWYKCRCSAQPQTAENPTQEVHEST